MIYVGIDPGLVSGAWAAIDHHGAYVACAPIPHADRRIDVRQWRDDLLRVLAGQDASIGLESVHSMPGQGVASTFAFGRAVGAIEALLDLLPWPVQHLQPRAWKKSMGVTADKATSLTLARELWPTAPLKRQKDHGCAEALLMAEHMRRTWS
jgi:crossover junction endodeoxyribonuclease RuvC